MYGLKIIKLVIVIFNFTYLVAMGWMIMLKSIEDFHHGVHYSQLDFGDPAISDSFGDNFITKFGI